MHIKLFLNYQHAFFLLEMEQILFLLLPSYHFLSLSLSYLVIKDLRVNRNITSNIPLLPIVKLLLKEANALNPLYFSTELEIMQYELHDINSLSANKSTNDKIFMLYPTFLSFRGHQSILSLQVPLIPSKRFLFPTFSGTNPQFFSLHPLILKPCFSFPIFRVLVHSFSLQISQERTKQSPILRAGSDSASSLAKKRTRHRRVLKTCIFILFRYRFKVFHYFCFCRKCKHLICYFFCFFHCPPGHYLTCCKDGCWAYREFI